MYVLVMQTQMRHFTFQTVLAIVKAAIWTLAKNAKYDSEVVSVSGGDDTSGGEDGGTYWNGLWYASSDDNDDSDDYDDSCTSDDDCEAETDDSNI